MKDEKEELEIELNNQTIAEVLRDYLNSDDKVKLAAWKREHPSKPVVFHIKTSGKSAKKVLQDAISRIEKETSKLLDEIKKAK